MAAKPCRVCGEPLVGTRLGTATGTSAGWQVEFIDFPIVACPSAHERREAYPDFNTDWHERAMVVLGLPNQHRGLLSRRCICRGCSTELGEPTNACSEVRVQTKPGYEFGMKATGPMVRCSCGTDTVRDGEADRLTEAFIDFLERSGIRRRS